MAQILVFGDSIAWGAWDREGGWVQRLRNFLDERTLSITNFQNTDYFMVYNLGISGDTSELLLKRFKTEVKQRLFDEKGETFIAFAIGKNDSRFIKSRNAFEIPPEKFEENIRELIKIAKKYSSKIIFIGAAVVDEKKTTPWIDNRFYKNEYLEIYNEIIKNICNENKIHFIEVSETFMKSDYKNLLEDGLHPNSEGHKNIFEIVKDFLLKEKII